MGSGRDKREREKRDGRRTREKNRMYARLYGKLGKKLAREKRVPLRKDMKDKGRGRGQLPFRLPVIGMPIQANRSRNTSRHPKPDTQKSALSHPPVQLILSLKSSNVLQTGSLTLLF